MQVSVCGLAWWWLGSADSAAPGHRGDCSPGFRASLGISEKCGELEGSTEGDQWIEVISILPLWQRSVRAKVVNWRGNSRQEGRKGGKEGGKRDVHSPFGIVWVKRGRLGSKRSRRRAGVSISPKLSRVNGGRCRGRRRRRRRVKERNDSALKHLTLLKVLRWGLQFAFLAGWGFLL